MLSQYVNDRRTRDKDVQEINSRSLRQWCGGWSCRFTDTLFGVRVALKQECEPSEASFSCGTLQFCWSLHHVSWLCAERSECTKCTSALPVQRVVSLVCNSQMCAGCHSIINAKQVTGFINSRASPPRNSHANCRPCDPHTGSTSANRFFGPISIQMAALAMSRLTDLWSRRWWNIKCCQTTRYGRELSSGDATTNSSRSSSITAARATKTARVLYRRQWAKQLYTTEEASLRCSYRLITGECLRERKAM